jgi:hypothetical protein
MVEVVILFGSSCVGKSYIMIHSKNVNYSKVEMDNCKYWLKEREKECISYLIEHIKKNNNKKNMIITCGALPLPTHPIYKELENDYKLKFKFKLVLVDNVKTLIKNIIRRKRHERMNELIEKYNYLEGKKDLFDSIIVNN